MLLIGDIHIQATYSKKILDSVREFINDQPDEQNIIFVGDYVYHFSYHRKSLLALFALFVELYQQGKNVYVLAGNHDRLGEHFVYAEGQHAMSALTQETNDNGSLHFITKPMRTSIEGQEILFLPFMLRVDDSSHDINQEFSLDEKIIKQNPLLMKIHETSKQLKKSDNKYEQFSGALNELLLSHVTANDIIQNNSPMTVIHHYYIANTTFPGQKTSFKYRDIALSPDWMSYNKISMISGHIHQAFTLQNYLCTGSVWSTSPLEFNQQKYLRKWNTKTAVFEAYANHVNPYLRLELDDHDNIVTQEFLDEKRRTIEQQSLDNISTSDHYTIAAHSYALDREHVNLSLVTPQVDYSLLSRYVESDLHDRFATIKLYKKRQSVSNLLAQLETSTKDFSGGWHDWKAILEEYITKKYPEEKESYFAELKDLGLY